MVRRTREADGQRSRRAAGYPRDVQSQRGVHVRARGRHEPAQAMSDGRRLYQHALRRSLAPPANARGERVHARRGRGAVPHTPRTNAPLARQQTFHQQDAVLVRRHGRLGLHHRLRARHGQFGGLTVG